MPSFIYMSPSGESKEVPLDQINGVEDIVSIAREVHQLDKPTEKRTKHRVRATLPNGKEISCLTFKNHCYLVACTDPTTGGGFWFEDKRKAEKRAKYLSNWKANDGSPYAFVVVPVTRDCD